MSIGAHFVKSSSQYRFEMLCPHDAENLFKEETK